MAVLGTTLPSSWTRSDRSRFLCSLTYFAMQYKRTWRSSLGSNVVYPILYLTAMGVGLGHLINAHVGLHPSSLGGLSYLAFLAPGILASSSMQIAVQESTYPVLGSIRWTYAYTSMVATPLRVVDVFRGQLSFIAFRLAITCATFTAVAAAFGALSSPEAIAMVPAGILCGLAFAAPVCAFAARQEYDMAFAVLNRLLVIPLFLFSGTFFPIRQLPSLLRDLAVITPLYHGVTLSRSLATGDALRWSSLGHVAYLVALCALGYAWGCRTFERRLAS